MIVTIITGVVVLFILGIIGIGYSIYSFNNKKQIMNGEQKTKALDIFMYLGLAITLVWSVVNLLQIVFSAIDRKFVDIISNGVYTDIYSSDVRLAIASLLVMYPLYIGLSWYVSKDIQKFLYKRDLTIRKVMIYATLFVTLCTLIGTLVSIIYTYLGGEISVRFELKALTVFAVALSVFGYYFYSLRRDYAKATNIPIIVTVVATILVLGSLVWSVNIIGTPAEMRAKRIDNTRLSDISRLQQEIYNRFQTADKLPDTVSELNDAFSGYLVPVDPITNIPYKYKVITQPVFSMDYQINKKVLANSPAFELCATFDTVREYDSRGQNLGKGGMGGAIDSMYSVSNYYYEGDQSPLWNHGVGETCFKRVISPSMYYGR